MKTGFEIVPPSEPRKIRKRGRDEEGDGKKKKERARVAGARHDSHHEQPGQWEDGVAAPEVNVVINDHFVRQILELNCGAADAVEGIPEMPSWFERRYAPEMERVSFPMHIASPLFLQPLPEALRDVPGLLRGIEAHLDPILKAEWKRHC